jgi:hypothetical protein
MKKNRPEWKDTLNKTEFSIALNWFSVNNNNGNAMKYLQRYLKEKHQIKASIIQLKASNISATIGYVAELINEGCEIPKISQDSFYNGINEVLKALKEPVPENSTTPVRKTKVSAIKMDSVAGLLEYEIDKFMDRDFKPNGLSITKLLQSQKITQKETKGIIEHFSVLRDELDEVIEKPDKDLKESYKYLKKPQLRRFLKFMDGILEDCTNHIVSSKKPRKSKTQATLVSNIEELA